MVKSFSNWLKSKVCNWLEDDFVLKCKKLHPDAKLPNRSAGSVGYDLYSVEDVVIPPFYAFANPYLSIQDSYNKTLAWHGDIPDYKNTVLVSTGLAIEIPRPYAFLIWDRSGMGSKGIHRLAGVVDYSYRGEVKVCLTNLTTSSYVIKKGDRIAQALIQKVAMPEPVWADELSDSTRGEKGWGSSGR